ncbi:MAG TPA: hypothetical protein DEH78_22210, partial [Solibacterales bacterium]|nr:hypothetical protein [Bryobacterales bacterium]
MTNIAPEPSKHGSGERAIRSKGEPPAGGRFGSWPLLTLAFGSLVALMIVSGVATVNKATNLYSTLSRLNREYRQHWRSVEEIQSGIHVSSVLIRDYLLDPSQERAKETRDELLKVRKQMEGLLAPAELAHLRKEIDAYWDTFDPVFEWEADDKKAMGFWFLRQRVMPRREAALALALEAQNLTEVTFRRQREEIRQNEEELRGYVWRMLAATVLLGALVAAGSIVRVWQLEKRSRRAEDEMRRLSHELVSAQEEERRGISRGATVELGAMVTRGGGGPRAPRPP